MKTRWFSRFGMVFIPSTMFGWLVFLTAAGAAVYAFIVVDRKSHSVSDTLINLVVPLVVIAGAYWLLSWATSRNGKNAE